MARQGDIDIEMQPYQSVNSTEEECERAEKKKKRINFSSDVQVSERTPSKPGKTVQFSKPQISIDDHSSVAGVGSYEIKACLIPNKKREEEEVMENLRKKVGEHALNKNFKQHNEGSEDGKTVDQDCETNPLLNTKSEPQTTDKDFIIDCLCWHNEYRARHNVTAMNLSKKLCVSAQEWANHIASRDELYYCPPSSFNFGQSIFCCAETAVSWKTFSQLVHMNFNSQIVNIIAAFDINFGTRSRHILVFIYQAI